MTRKDHMKHLEKCRDGYLKCIEAAERCKRGYEFWKNQNGLKAFINRKIFSLCNKMQIRIATSWFKSELKELACFMTLFDH